MTGDGDDGPMRRHAVTHLASSVFPFLEAPLGVAVKAVIGTVTAVIGISTPTGRIVVDPRWTSLLKTVLIEMAMAGETSLRDAGSQLAMI